MMRPARAETPAICRRASSLSGKSVARSGPVVEMTADTPPLPALVEMRARATPDRVALTSVDQGAVTWRELESASFRWANWLLRHGIGEGDHVVTLVPQSLEAAYVWLA